MLHRGELNMAKKSIKKTVEEVVKEVKAEDIPVEVVKEETKCKKLFLDSSSNLQSGEVIKFISTSPVQKSFSKTGANSI